MTRFPGNFVLAAGDRALEAPLAAYARELAAMSERLAAAGALPAARLSAAAGKPGWHDFLLHPDHAAPVRALFSEIILGERQGCAGLGACAEAFAADVGAFLGGVPCPVADAGAKVPGATFALTPVRNNPYDAFDAHPDHASGGAAVGWGGRPEREWLSVFGRAWDLLGRAHPATRDEASLLVRKAVPLGTSETAHNSGSYREAVGALYLGYLVGVELPEVAVMEAVVHEASHNKLNLLARFAPLVHDDFREAYYSPWRPDPRHMTGIFLGLHAFAAVVRVLLGAYAAGVLSHAGWLDKVLSYHVKNELAFRVVARRAKLAPAGAAVLAQISAVMADSRRLAAAARVSAGRLAAAGEAARGHAREAFARHPGILA